MAEGRGRGPGRCLGEELEGLPAGWLEERRRRGISAKGKDRGGGGGGDTRRGRRGGAGQRPQGGGAGGPQSSRKTRVGTSPAPRSGQGCEPAATPARAGPGRAEGGWAGRRRGVEGPETSPRRNGRRTRGTTGCTCWRRRRATRPRRPDPAGRGGISPPVNQKPGRRGNCLPCLGREREGSQEEKKQVRRGGRSHCAVHTAETGTTL